MIRREREQKREADTKRSERYTGAASIIVNHYYYSIGGDGQSKSCKRLDLNTGEVIVLAYALECVQHSAIYAIDHKIYLFGINSPVHTSHWTDQSSL
jgi:hypothetical protein